ncbi:MAG TPA: SDR family oxidoreductase [Gemmatimonadota bacterium]|jgi:NAD(P)-dependent dehydrogenase (short-subunit alcohol dehydrogenase family)
MADWVLVLGSSSGFGEACARAFAADGFNVYGVHLDRKSTMAHVDEIVSAIRGAGREVEFFNVNAADPAKREEIVRHVRGRLGADDHVRVLLHSLAFGTLKPYIGKEGQAGLAQRELEMTLDVMANSLLYWVRDLVENGLMREGGRIYSMTSTGDFHAWPSYGAVSAAKAALEAHTRQLALELAPRGITVNAIRAGVTDTPALRKIPGSAEMVESAAKRNPHGRLTTPEDVARALVVLSRPETAWITGNVIGVDGGEEIAG